MTGTGKIGQLHRLRTAVHRVRAKTPEHINSVHYGQLRLKTSDSLSTSQTASGKGLLKFYAHHLRDSSASHLHLITIGTRVMLKVSHLHLITINTRAMLKHAAPLTLSSGDSSQLYTTILFQNSTLQCSGFLPMRPAASHMWLTSFVNQGVMTQPPFGGRCCLGLK